MSIAILSCGLVAGAGCAGVKSKESSGSGGTTGKGGSGGSGVVTGTGGTPQNLPVTPISGSFSCTDFDTSGACVSFDTGTESQFGNGSSGSTTIAYPLDGALFPGNLGPIQVQMTTPGTSARITLQTTSSSNVNVQYFGTCESAPGSGCSVTLPVQFTEMLIPACQTEDIQITASVLSGSSPTGDSPPINVAWAASGLTGGLYFWTVVPNPPKKSDTGDIPTPPTYILLDPTQTSGTQIERYDFSQDNPTPQVVWTDDGGPGSTPPYDGAPQSWVSGTAGGHCIGCHTITNDGKYMALTIGGSSTTNAANWELLDIQNQALELINPVGGGGLDTNSDPSATPTNDPANYWKSYRNEGYAAETSWGPNGDVMVSMFNSKLYFNTVAVNGTSATVTRQGALFPTSLSNVSNDPYQSDPFWSHDGTTFVFTSFNQQSPNGGTDGDLKLNGQIGIASATKEMVNDDAKILVSRGNNQSSYYPCVSEDSNYVVFNTSTCSSGNDPSPLGGGYGIGSCDGYDDASAELWWVPSGGGATTRLDRANGIVNGQVQNYSNSWPRFSPDVGTFRGQTLYWIAFSSRRPYGIQANTGGLSGSQPQLWFTGVTSGEINVGDPSHSPVWLPGQNPMGNGTLYGNHVPQWVKVAIIIN
ncbi:MAG TPA: hypothetical protein VHG72_20505 [Polyangia bacterium]|nr:hypothetical protein [Polyangia bacterium]